MSESPLNEIEIKLLKELVKGPRLIVDKAEAQPRVKGLIERGYCKTSKARSGPLGIYTGELMMSLTEAGRLVLETFSV